MDNLIFNNVNEINIEYIDDYKIKIINFPSIEGNKINKNGLFIPSELLKEEVNNYKNLIKKYPYYRYMLDGHQEKNIEYVYSYDSVIGYIEDIRYDVVNNIVLIDFILFNKDNIIDKIIKSGFPISVSSIFYPDEVIDIPLEYLINDDYNLNYYISKNEYNRIKQIFDRDIKYLSEHSRELLYLTYLKKGRLIRFDVVQFPAYESWGWIRNSINKNENIDIKISGFDNIKKLDDYIINNIKNYNTNDYITNKKIEYIYNCISKSPDLIISKFYSNKIKNMPKSNNLFNNFIDLYVIPYIEKYRIFNNMYKIINIHGYKPLINKIK